MVTTLMAGFQSASGEVDGRTGIGPGTGICVPSAKSPRDTGNSADRFTMWRVLLVFFTGPSFFENFAAILAMIHHIKQLRALADGYEQSIDLFAIHLVDAKVDAPIPRRASIVRS